MAPRTVPGPQRAWGTKRRSSPDWKPSFYARKKIQRAGTGTYTYDEGTAVFSGNGSTRIFVINHLLAVLPRYHTVTSASPDARPPFTTIVTSTQITVTFSEAPLVGVNNVSLAWLVTTG